MGSNTQTTTAKVPEDMTKARGSLLEEILKGLASQQKAPFNLTYQPNELTTGANDMYKTLLGGTAGGAGGPQGVSGQTLDTMMPMAGITPDITNMLREGLSSGFAIDTSPVWAAKKAAYAQNIKDSITQAMQDMSFTGSRYGTGAMNVGGNIANRGALSLASEMAPIEAGALEGAAGRKLQAGGLGLNLAEMYNRAALERAGAASGAGQQQFANEQTMQDKEYNEWLRTQPGYGPLFAALQQYSTQYPFQQDTTTKQSQSFSSLLASILGTAAGGFASGYGSQLARP